MWTALGILAAALVGLITVTTQILMRRISALFAGLRTEMVLRFEMQDQKFSAKFEQIDKRFGGVETRLDRVEDRFDRVEERFDRLEQKVEGLDRDVQAISKWVFPEERE